MRDQAGGWTYAAALGSSSGAAGRGGGVGFGGVGGHGWGFGVDCSLWNGRYWFVWTQSESGFEMSLSLGLRWVLCLWWDEAREYIGPSLYIIC